MGGNGSGRSGGRPTVEASYRLDIEALARTMAGCANGAGRIVWQDDFAVNFEWNVSDPLYAWVQLRFHDVEQFIYLCRSQPHFGGDRWWFECPREHLRVRMLYLPPGGSLFASRRAHRLAYASQRESVIGRAIRRARKIKARLSGDATLLGKPPNKPLRMRWATYRRLTTQLAVAEQEASKPLSKMLARWAR